ncbi:thioesterase family protein [Streptomyces sp. NPDC050560]|uniref:thioesterase family protein n=1 Tax=Streptomyces sp. NPDC050560 TaxID=3365630 RepID=UPI0037AD6E3D
MADAAPQRAAGGPEPRGGTIGDSEFDRDTAVTPRSPGEYGAELSGNWSVLGAVNGGYLLAVAARALGDALPHRDPFTITAHYLTASRPGPAVIRTERVRAGRTLSTGTASLLQYDEGGAEVERIRLLASYGDLDALGPDVGTLAKPPTLPPPERCVGPDDMPEEWAAFESTMAQRLWAKADPATLGWVRGAPSGRAETRAWMALADGRAPDPLSLLLAVDTLPPTAFDLGHQGWVPTVELTVHVRARPVPGPLRVAIRTLNPAGGYLEEDAEVWDSADRLVAQSRQLARMER